ncbi:Tigger transposable element-derived protein 6 [Trichinella pseudospiralis]|uniref:Tigger transposable element-derived protein 6 n=1 Tax=Trichinella pseudospiralis TaxID=6337 RepID=A0A0V1EHL7_TRIPS|nr:Tigger transposable element-derived protein 6 [Trichinella pseudospiralis]
MPDETLTFKGENCSGGKLGKERLTVLLCCNENENAMKCNGTEMLRPLCPARPSDTSYLSFRSKLPNSAVVKNTDKSVTISKEWQQIAETDVTFSDYLKGILEQHQADANKENNDNDDDDDDKEQEVLPTLTLTAVLEAMDTLRRYVCSFDVDENVNNQMSKKGTVICELRKT